MASTWHEDLVVERVRYNVNLSEHFARESFSGRKTCRDLRVVRHGPLLSLIYLWSGTDSWQPFECSALYSSSISMSSGELPSGGSCCYGELGMHASLDSKGELRVRVQRYRRHSATPGGENRLFLDESPMDDARAEYRIANPGGNTSTCTSAFDLGHTPNDVGTDRPSGHILRTTDTITFRRCGMVT